MIQDVRKIYLCRPDFSLITQLNGVKTETVEYTENVKDFDELTFSVCRHIVVDGKRIESNGYEQLDVYMYLYLEDIGFFQMQSPRLTNDGDNEIKNITAYSCEKEFLNVDWTNFKVNTGEKDSLERVPEDNVDDAGFTKEFIVFYRPSKPELSLLNLILEKMPGWSIDDKDIDHLLWNVKLSIDEDNTNLYALLTSTIAPKAECVFLFDIMHRKLKAVSKYNIEYDTNIFIGVRNLVNNVDITVNEDSVYTKLNCQGSDGLTFRNVNYGDSYIINLDYFMGQPYMDDEIVQKIKMWQKYRDDNRDEFINITTSRANIEAKIYEIKYRVPNDADVYSQWDGMDKDLLDQNLKYWETTLEKLQISVDENPKYTDDGKYRPWRLDDGNINHEKYLELLYDMTNGYGGYYTYIEILNYILPNINIAIENIGAPEGSKKDYVKDYETNWELYGTIELENKKKAYEEELAALEDYKKPWSELTDEEKSTHSNSEQIYNSAGHNKYLEISGYIGTEETPGTLLYQYKKLSDEIDVLNSQQEELNKRQVLLRSESLMTDSKFGFTDEDFAIINPLLVSTDYQNSNILTTSIDTTVTRIGVEKELYKDSIDKLSELSQPQYNFQVDMDNLIYIPEFKIWKDDFRLLRYIRLGIRDDYSVKLRIVGKIWNPCEVTPNITLTFSNMITSASGRSDLTEMLNNENNRSGKNKISIGLGNSDSDREYLTNLLTQITTNPVFKNTVQGIANNANVKLDTAEVNRIIGEYAKFMEIDVGKIKGDEASFNKFFADYSDIGTLSADLANIHNAIVGVSSTDTGIVFNLNAGNANIDEAYIKNEIAKKITVADLAAGNIVLSDSMQILSENGKLIMNGKVLQIKGKDSAGNDYVGVQLGYDTTDKPSLILRDENGATILTSNGITKDAIADNLIVNNMINNGTIEKVKLAFQILEPNEKGGVNLSQVYDGEKQFGAVYAEFKDKINGDIGDLTSSIAGVSSVVDSVKKNITEKIWQQDITDYDNNQGKAIRDRVTATETSLSGVTTKVTDVETVLNGTGQNPGLVSKVSNVEQKANSIEISVESVKNDLTTEKTKIKQTSDLLSLMATSSDGGSSFTLTDKMLEMVSGQVVVKNAAGDRTIINGDKMLTGSITTKELATDAIKSTNYANSDGPYSAAGTFLDLSTGKIISQNFRIDADGSLHLKGEVIADSGEVGGFAITETCIRTKDKTLDSTDSGSIGLSTVDFSRKIGNVDRTGLRYAIGSNFAVDKDGNVYCNNGNFSGVIDAKSGGSIANFNINNNSISYGTLGSSNSVVISPGTSESADIAGSGSKNNWAFTVGNSFGVTSSGAVYANDVNLFGKINASGGKIGHFKITDAGLYWDDGTTSADKDIVIFTPSEINLDNKFIYTPTRIDIEGKVFINGGVNIGSYTINGDGSNAVFSSYDEDDPNNYVELTKTQADFYFVDVEELTSPSGKHYDDGRPTHTCIRGGYITMDYYPDDAIEEADSGLIMTEHLYGIHDGARDSDGELHKNRYVAVMGSHLRTKYDGKDHPFGYLYLGGKYNYNTISLDSGDSTIRLGTGSSNNAYDTIVIDGENRLMNFKSGSSGNTYNSIVLNSMNRTIKLYNRAAVGQPVENTITFDGTTGEITCCKVNGSASSLTTPRTLKIGGSGKSFDGTSSVTWTLSEIGAANEDHTHDILDINECVTDNGTKLTLGTGSSSSAGSGKLVIYSNQGTRWMINGSSTLPSNLDLYLPKASAGTYTYFATTSTSSDEKLKNIIQIDERYDDFFYKINPVLFTYTSSDYSIDGDNRVRLGFGARQIKSALMSSNLKYNEFYGLHYDLSTDLYSISYDQFNALSIRQIQKQKEEINSLKSEVEYLKSQIDELKSIISH